MTSMPAIAYDPFQPHDDPYPLFAAMREHAPAYHNPERAFWALTRFADVQAASRDWATFSNAEGVDLDDTGELWAPGGFVDFDPPEHKRMRTVLHTSFAPASVRKALEDPVRAKVRALLDEVAATASPDLAVGLARPLPSWVVCSWLGFPEADHADLDRWFEGMLVRRPGATAVPEDAWRARREMVEYLDAAIEQRLRHPGDDLLSTMVRAHADGALSRDELIGMCVFIFFAGINTTIGLIGHALLLLAQHPEQRDRLRREPALIPAAVEEVLRYEPPIQWLARVTTRDVELHDLLIPAGERLILVYAAANRDPARYEDPDRFDVGRSAQRHLGFGEGIHHCLGAPLARLELRVVLEEMLRRMGDWELAGDVERIFTPGERIVSRLPVRL
jgi:cytochrome P450